MNISKEQLKHIAALARLDIAEHETDLFAAQIGNILGYIDILNQVDTTGVIPTSHAVPLTNAFREDVESPHLEPELALSNAPEKDDDYFLVPRVI